MSLGSLTYYTCTNFVVIQCSHIVVYLYTNTQYHSVNLDFRVILSVPD